MSGTATTARSYIQKAIEIAQRDIAITSTVEVADVVSFMAEGLFLDPAVFFDDEGEVLPLRDMPAEARRHISEIKRERRKTKDGDVITVTTIKWSSKESYADKMMRHLGGYNDRLVVEHDASRIIEALNEGRERVARMKTIEGKVAAE